MAEEGFIADFKVAEVRPLYKYDGRADKSNYQPISILSNVSKICERFYYSQLYDYFDKKIFQNTNVVFLKALVLSMTF